MNNLLKYAAVFLTTFFLLKSASSGSVEGPYVIWINASDNKNIDNVIKYKINNNKINCGHPEFIIFMNTRPALITTKLTSKALIHNKYDAKIRLNRLLKQSFEDIQDGFDGVILYSDNPRPILYSITTGSTKVLKVNIANPADKNEVWNGFCFSQPSITRNP